MRRKKEEIKVYAMCNSLNINSHRKLKNNSEGSVSSVNDGAVLPLLVQMLPADLLHHCVITRCSRQVGVKLHFLQLLKLKMEKIIMSPKTF